MHYTIGSGEGISYQDPEPLSFSNHLGDFDLVDQGLRIKPTEHFSNEGEARKAIEPFLRDWEIESDLTSNVGAIRFTFTRVELIDRDPPPPTGPPVINMKAAIGACAVTGKASLTLTYRKYPRPPQTFCATSEVQLAYRRWVGFRSGKEPLPAMAYFVLTLLESLVGNRRSAACTFQIDQDILNTIGKLSSTKGDESTARKVERKSGSVVPFQELSGAEKQWLEEAVPKVIRQLGQHASGAPLTRLTMNDLPRI
jgi:hypothetical protein